MPRIRNIIDPALSQVYLDSGNYNAAELQIMSEAEERMWQELQVGKTPLQPGQLRRIEQIVGVNGSGKSTLAKELLKSTYHADHSIVIDPDELRKRTKFFDATIQEGMDAGMSFEEADLRSMRQWNPGCISIMINLMNRAANEGFAILRTGRPGGPITDSVCANAEDAEFHLTTAILIAPYKVCEQGIKARVAAGGSPSNMSDNRKSHDKVLNHLSYLFRLSDQVNFYWRGKLEQNPAYVARFEHASLTTIDNQGLSALMNSFGKATAAKNLAYLTGIQGDRNEMPRLIHPAFTFP